MGLKQQVSEGTSFYMFRDTDIEKRQLFLRSYQFSRKRSVAERIKRTFFRVKRVIWFRLRSARKVRKMVWLKLKLGLFAWRRKKIFLRLHNHNTSFTYDSCFW